MNQKHYKLAAIVYEGTFSMGHLCPQAVDNSDLKKSSGTECEEVSMLIVSSNVQ